MCLRSSSNTNHNSILKPLFVNIIDVNKDSFYPFDSFKLQNYSETKLININWYFEYLRSVYFVHLFLYINTIDCFVRPYRRMLCSVFKKQFIPAVNLISFKHRWDICIWLLDRALGRHIRKLENLIKTISPILTTACAWVQSQHLG